MGAPLNTCHFLAHGSLSTRNSTALYDGSILDIDTHTDVISMLETMPRIHRLFDPTCLSINNGPRVGYFYSGGEREADQANGPVTFRWGPASFRWTVARTML